MFLTLAEAEFGPDGPGAPFLRTLTGVSCIGERAGASGRRFAAKAVRMVVALLLLARTFDWGRARVGCQ